MNWLGFSNWMTNPAMLGAGALAVSIPIIIHLLNKRRFKIVDWAAMDFLFDADKKNRRRVRIENLILLLLRCAVMLLIGLMLARPFNESLPTWLASKQQVERIVLLDDSLSMKVVSNNKSALESAKNELKAILAAISNDEKDDMLTLYLTSQPDRPLVSNELVNDDSLDAISQQIDDIEISQGAAHYEEALLNIDRYVSSQKEGVSRVAYIFTDLRLKDWGNPETTKADEETTSSLMAKLSNNDRLADCFIVDAGAGSEENLAITKIQPSDLEVGSKDSVSYEVTVKNLGREAAKDVKVRFKIGDNAPQTETIESIAPGEEQKKAFIHSYVQGVTKESLTRFLETNESDRLNVEIVAEIVRDGANDDILPDDNESYFAANVLKAIPILTVNGDPSSQLQENETYMLEAMLGNSATGGIVESVTVNQFLTTPLSKYKIIFVCNVDAFSKERMKTLEQWVSDGGCLVIMPGNRVRASEYNVSFYKDGKGLSPIRLKAISGDATKSTWVSAAVSDPNHPSLSATVEGLRQAGLSYDSLSIFSWWDNEIPTEQLRQTTSVVLRMTDKDQTPLMCERKFNKGRVVTFAIPADGDWSNWNSNPQIYVFLGTLVDLVNYFMNVEQVTYDVPVGGTISHPVELSLYETSISLIDPNEEKMSDTAQSRDESDLARETMLYQTEFTGLKDRGFYKMLLTRKTGQVDSLLFSVNVDANESDLKRLDTGAINQSYFGERTQLVSVKDINGVSVSAGESEIWFNLLVALMCVLGVEQFLGWWFGRKR